MDDRTRVWMWRARRVDSTWRDGIPTDGGTTAPGIFRETLLRVAPGILLGLAQDELSLRGARVRQRWVDPEEIVDDVIRDHINRLDPTDGVHLAIAKLQLAILEVIDRELRGGDLLDEDDLIDREYTDERGLVDFL